MDVSCPSLPPKLLAADQLRPKAHTTPGKPVTGRNFVECSLYVQLININVFLTCAFYVLAQVVLYKTGPPILSRRF